MPQRRARTDDGYAMVALLVGMAIMAIMMSAAMPVWRTAVLREREAELIFRGNQYGRAIALFQRKYGGAFPPSIDVLVNEHFLRKKYKDPITGDDFQLVGPGAAVPGQGAVTPGAPTPGARTPGAPTAGAAPQGGQRPPFGGAASTPGASAGGTLSRAASGLGGAPAGGIMGVASKSTAKSLALFNGRDKYNEWIFVGTQASTRAGAGATGGAAGGVSGTGRPGGARTGAPPGGGGGAGGGPTGSRLGLPTRPSR